MTNFGQSMTRARARYELLKGGFLEQERDGRHKVYTRSQEPVGWVSPRVAGLLIPDLIEANERAGQQMLYRARKFAERGYPDGHML